VLIRDFGIGQRELCQVGAEKRAGCIPTSLNGDVGFCMPIGVEATIGMEQVEFVIGEREILVPKLSRQLDTMLAMPIIKAFIGSPGIAENSEKLNHFDVGAHFFGKVNTDFQNSSLMGNAMRPVNVQGIIFENGVNKGFEVEHGMNHFFFINSATRVCILSSPFEYPIGFIGV
jgi:hypothetical protein